MVELTELIDTIRSRVLHCRAWRWANGGGARRKRRYGSHTGPAAHPCYTRLNQILDKHEFDGYVEDLCQRFYADEGRPSRPQERYFRLLLIGHFEAMDAERAIAWRAADSFAVPEFFGRVLPVLPDYSTMPRTRRLIDLEMHQAIFTDVGLVERRAVGIDETTLEANAALRSIVRRDTGESYHAFLTKLAQAWMNPNDPDAKITKMKDGRTHLAHKAEHAVDLEMGAVVAVTIQDADERDMTTSHDTLAAAAE